jgi:hypothetical protein
MRRDDLLCASATNGASDAEAAEWVEAPTQQQPAVDSASTSGSESGGGAAEAPGASASAVRSHPLALQDDPFAAEELVQELSDTTSLGKRGEAFVAAQVLTMLFVLFPPFRLVVRGCDKGVYGGGGVCVRGWLHPRQA